MKVFEKKHLYFLWTTLLLVVALAPQSLNKIGNTSFRGSRSITSEVTCNNLVTSIVNNDRIEIKPNELALKESREVFWKKHNAVYVRGKLDKNLKAIIKKAKILLMNLNGSERPIYYIENDESYIQIFKFIEENARPDEETVNNQAFKKVSDEVLGWITRYKNYKYEMNSYIEELAINTATINEINKIKKDDNYKYPFKLVYSKYNPEREAVEFVDDIDDKEELDEILIRLKGRNSKIQGNLLRGPGQLKTRDFEQGILRQRLVYLKREIKDLVANNKELVKKFEGISNSLSDVLDNPELAPSILQSLKLEWKEYKAERVAIYTKAKLNKEKLSDFSKMIIDNLSERHKVKLGLGSEKQWADSLRYGRWGVWSASIAGSGGYAGYSVILYAYNWWNYHKDKKYEIVNAKSDDEFNEGLQEYLKQNFDIKLSMRIQFNDKKEVMLKNYDPKNKKDVEFLDTIKEILSLRIQFKKDEEILENTQQKLTEIIENIQNATQEDDGQRKEKIDVEKKERKFEENSEDNTVDRHSKDDQECLNEERRKTLHKKIEERKRKKQQSKTKLGQIEQGN